MVRITLVLLLLGLVSCTDDSLPPVETMDNTNGVRHTMVSDVKEMCLVPDGEFTMGDVGGDTDARPPHKVRLGSFYIDKTEVTNGAYAKFLEHVKGGDHSTCHPGEPKGKDHTPAGWKGNEAKDLPVVGVDWWDACAYAGWKGLRLPTEAEWERAARGAEGRTYPWGEEWNAEAASSAEAFSPGLVEATRFEEGRSQAGVYNLAGNAREWCADGYLAEAYAKLAAEAPRGPDDAPTRVIRGGGWHDDGPALKTYRRDKADPATRKDDLGFRCALDAAKAAPGGGR